MQAQLLAIGRQIDACKYLLLVPGLPQLQHFLPKLLQRLGAHPSPGIGDDTIGTEPVTPVLDLQKCSGPAMKRRHGHLFKRFPLLVRGNIHDSLLGGKVLHHPGQQIPSPGVSQHHIGFQQTRCLLWERLGHASGEHHHRSGIVPLGPAQRLADLLVAGSRHRAGVDHHNIGLLTGSRLLKPAGEQCLQHGLGFILIHLAAKGDDFCLHVGMSPLFANSCARSTVEGEKPRNSSRRMAFWVLAGPGRSR